LNFFIPSCEEPNIAFAGMRIFRMLLDKKQLEQKQIAEFAMVPVRDAREVLYKMLKAGFLALQVWQDQHLVQSEIPCLTAST
jgi:transcription initiation factor IIE alpha subunit